MFLLDDFLELLQYGPTSAFYWLLNTVGLIVAALPTNSITTELIGAYTFATTLSFLIFLGLTVLNIWANIRERW